MLAAQGGLDANLVTLIVGLAGVAAGVFGTVVARLTSKRTQASTDMATLVKALQDDNAALRAERKDIRAEGEKWRLEYETCRALRHHEFEEAIRRVLGEPEPEENPDEEH